MNKFEIDPFVERFQDRYILFHGTQSDNVDRVLKEGLKGGDNTTGGTHGTFENPILFLARDRDVAKKYGIVLAVYFTKEQFMDLDEFIDGIGDQCYSLEGEAILITADRIEVDIIQEYK